MDPSVVAEMPGLKAPPGVKPNFVNPESQAVWLTFTIILCVVISTLLVWLRIYTKSVITRSIGWEDYTSILAWFGLMAYMIPAVLCLQHNVGVHQWNVKLRDVMEIAKLVNYVEIIYSIVIFFTKLSILLQYLRVFVPARRSILYYVIQAYIWINLVFYIATVLARIFQCTPRAKIWNPYVKGHCIDGTISLVSTGSINVLSDVSILILPLYPIWHLQLPLRKKIGISAVFATGLFACISSIVRLFYSINLLHSKDLTYDLLPLGNWSFAEITSGILCSCLPVLPRLFQHIGLKLTSKPSSYPSTNPSTKPLPPSPHIHRTYLSPDEIHSSTTISGGREKASTTATVTEADQGWDCEGGDLEKGNGIQKTVRVEVIPVEVPVEERWNI